MKTRTIEQVQYDKCDECPLFETPDENKEIPIPNGGMLRLAPFVYNKKGEKIPNPIVGRCGYTGKRITNPNGCATWFKQKKLTA